MSGGDYQAAGLDIATDILDVAGLEFPPLAIAGAFLSAIASSQASSPSPYAQLQQQILQQTQIMIEGTQVSDFQFQLNSNIVNSLQLYSTAANWESDNALIDQFTRWTTFAANDIAEVSGWAEQFYDQCSSDDPDQQSLCQQAVIGNNVWVVSHAFAMVELSVYGKIINITSSMGNNPTTWIETFQAKAQGHYQGLLSMWIVLQPFLSNQWSTVSCGNEPCGCCGCGSCSCTNGVYNYHHTTTTTNYQLMYNSYVAAAPQGTVTSQTLFSWAAGEDVGSPCTDEEFEFEGCNSQFCMPENQYGAWNSAADPLIQSFSEHLIDVAGGLIVAPIKQYGALASISQGTIEAALPSMDFMGWKNFR